MAKTALQNEQRRLSTARWRQRPEVKARYATPEHRAKVRARQAEWKRRPEVVARYSSPEYKAKALVRYHARLARPEVRARLREWRRAYEALPHVIESRRRTEAKRTRDASMRLGYELRKYSLTLEGFVALLAQQDNKCALCRSPDPGRGHRFHVDHDHKTGRVRGLLCTLCNAGLGQFRDSKDLLSRAIEYLGGGNA